MNYRSLIIWIVFLLFCYSLKAQEHIQRNLSSRTILPEEYLYLVGGDLNMHQGVETMRFVLADSSYIDLYHYDADSVLLIRTQCAPRCASFVKVYDSQWRVLRTIPSPRNMVFPVAYFLKDTLRWRDEYVPDESPE